MNKNNKLWREQKWRTWIEGRGLYRENVFAQRDETEMHQRFMNRDKQTDQKVTLFSYLVWTVESRLYEFVNIMLLLLCCFDFLAISVSFDYLRQSLWQDSIFLLYFSSKSVRLFAGEKKGKNVRVRTMDF